MPKVSAPEASEASVAHLPSRHSCDYSFVEDFVPVKTEECSGSSLQSSTWLAIFGGSFPYILPGVVVLNVGPIGFVTLGGINGVPKSHSPQEVFQGWRNDAASCFEAVSVIVVLHCLFWRKYPMDLPWLVVEAMKKSFECFKIDRQISPKKAP